MTITAFEPNRLVTYTSTQPGLPDAQHERRFEPDGAGFVYRLVVEYEPRSGIAGVFDQLLLARGIRRAFREHLRGAGARATPSAVTSLDRRKLKEQIHELYRSEHAELGERGTLERLERGRRGNSGRRSQPVASSSFRMPACWTAGTRSPPRYTAVSTAAPTV